MSEYLKIKYRNSCDFAGSVFSDPSNTFYYSIFLPVDVGNPSYELIDEGREDGEKNFIPDFRKLQKKFTFNVVVPEYLYDALCHAQVHDTLFITLKNNETSRAFNFQVQLIEWRDNSVAYVSVSFTVDYVVNYGCCNNDTIIFKRCITCNSKIKVRGWIDVTNDMFTDPLNNGVGDQYYYVVGEFEGNEIVRNRLYKYSYKANGWVLYTPKSEEAICWTSGMTNYKMYSDGVYWYPYLLMRSVVNSGTNVIVKGFCLPDTWIQLQQSTDGINYTNIGQPVDGNTFQNAGVIISGLTVGVTYYFKFNLYNNNCNYGYSNAYSIVKS